MVNISERKSNFFTRVDSFFDTYSKMLIVHADNVGSHHMQLIRKDLRGKATLLMGKNTMIRKCLRGKLEQNPKLSGVLDAMKGNVGIVFTDGDLAEVREIILKQKVPAVAKAGAISPCVVTIPAGDTGLEPTQTSFLQALNIATRINRGQIMILNPVTILKEGDKVGTSEAALLQKLNIRPFFYGLEVQRVYDDGSVYDPAVLDLTEDDLVSKFLSAITNIACVSFQVGIPTLASIPHSISRAGANIKAIALATDYTYDAIAELKALLDDPEALAAASAAAAASAPSSSAGGNDGGNDEPEEEEEESDDDMGFGLFD